MPRPRHPHRYRSIGVGLIVLALLATALTGCYRDQDPPRQFVPGDPLYEQFTTTGDRNLVSDADGNHTLKLRNRSHNTRVYNAQMIPVGQVWIEDGEIIDQSLDGQTRRRTKWLDDTTAVLDDAWRIDRLESRWEISDADGTSLGSWRVDDQKRWTMAYGGDSSAITYRVDIADGVSRIVDSNDQTHLQIAVDDWSEIKVLALALDELKALDRYALALWADKNL